MSTTKPAAVRYRARNRSTLAASAASAPLEPAASTSAPIVEVEISHILPPLRPITARDESLIEKMPTLLQRVRIPLVVDRATARVLGDANLLSAYQLLQSQTVPVIWVDAKDQAEVEAISLGLMNWFRKARVQDDVVREIVHSIMPDHIELADVTLFDAPELDEILYVEDPLQTNDGFEREPVDAEQLSVVTKEGQIWRWRNGSILGCGNTRDETFVIKLIGDVLLIAIIGDGPFGRTVRDLGVKSQTEEWKDGVGLSEEDVREQHAQTLQAAKPFLAPGAMVMLFTDWRALLPITQALRDAGLTQKNLCTWDKTSPALGRLYRQQTEYCIVAKNGMGQSYADSNPRMKRRSTLWSVPGYNVGRHDRKASLKNHACVKPQAVLIEIILDIVPPKGVFYDPWSGSGSGLVAAAHTGRRAIAAEINPAYCDTAARRLFVVTGEWPVDAESGKSFAEIAEEAGIAWPAEFEAACATQTSEATNG